MSKIKLSKFPVIITDDIYYKLNSNTEIKEDEIQSNINNDVKEYINRNVENYKEEFVEELTKDLRVSFPKKYINKYLDSSYLIKLKSSDIDLKAIQKYEEEIDNKEKSEEVRDVFKAYNKIIRKISKDRPNDFNKTIESIKESVNNYKDDFIEDKDVNEAIEDLIDEEEQKTDKLSKYVKETTKTFFKVTSEIMTMTYNKHKNDFIEKHSEEIDKAVKDFKDDFKHKYEKDIIKTKTNNIVNLKDYIYNNYTSNINFLDCGKDVILVFKTVYNSDEEVLYFFSDKISTEIIKVNKHDIDRIKRLGDTFTMVLKVEDEKNENV